MENEISTLVMSNQFMQQVKMLSSSNLVPANYQGEENEGNVAIALEYGIRYGIPAMTVMQNLYIVNGKPSWSSTFLISAFNVTKKNEYTPIRFKRYADAKGNLVGMSAYTKHIKSGEQFEGTQITLAMAQAEGWTSRNLSKWRTMPEQMLKYRAATFLIREICPEIAMGCYTADEQADIQANQAQTMAQSTVVDAEAVEIKDKAMNAINTAMKKMGGKPSLEERKKKMLELFHSKGITEEQICKRVEVDCIENIDEQKVDDLANIVKAVNDGRSDYAAEFAIEVA